MRPLKFGSRRTAEPNKDADSAAKTKQQTRQPPANTDSNGRLLPGERAKQQPPAALQRNAKIQGIATGVTRSITTPSTASYQSVTRDSAPPTPSLSFRNEVSAASSVRPLSSTSTRRPLQARDQNARLMTTRPPLNKSATMPSYERASNGGVRPQMPSLSAAAQRALNRSPLTPKIATKAPQTPAIGTNTQTPSARRPQRPTTSNGPIGSSSKPAEKEDELPSFLANITPRSGMRQNRVDSANTTPNGTPNPERTEGWDRGASPLTFDNESLRRPVVAFQATAPEANGLHVSESQNNTDSKFFYASDARTAQTQAPPSSKPALAKAPVFFYANGDSEKAATPASYTPFGGAAPVQDSSSNKFMYANGTPEMRSTVAPTLSRPMSAVSNTAKVPLVRPATAASAASYPIAQRPTSPVKFTLGPQLAPRPNGVMPTPLLTATNRVPVTSSPPLSQCSMERRQSSTGNSRGGHSRNGSLVSGDNNLRSSQILSEASSPGPASPFNPPQPLTLASIVQAAEELSEPDDLTSPDDSRSEIQSPTKSTHSVDPVSELVANARRERKVQDLQITNASLEAINRTLERQLRKQTAELRRFRRLSRSGRLSIASTAMSSRVVSESLPSGLEPDRAGLSDLDEAEFDEEEDFDDESPSDSDSLSDSANPSQLAERDAKHRARDEKRLQLDLSKHQQLLVDSQKMNQSIKRCLDWTEELIKDGKKALEYHVRVSDVDLGGRVLDPVDEEDELPAPSISVTPEDTTVVQDAAEKQPARLAAWGVALQDRDSGIELQVDGG